MKCKRMYLPLIDAPPTDPSTLMMTALVKAMWLTEHTMQLTEQTYQLYTVITCSQQVFKILVDIKWVNAMKSPVWSLDFEESTSWCPSMAVWGTEWQILVWRTFSVMLLVAWRRCLAERISTIFLCFANGSGRICRATHWRYLHCRWIRELFKWNSHRKQNCKGVDWLLRPVPLLKLMY